MLFHVKGSKVVHKQKVTVRPIEHHYEQDGEPENIKYGCPLCESLGTAYRKFYSHSSGLFDEDKQFVSFQIPKGTPNCPICGINLDWSFPIRFADNMGLNDPHIRCLANGPEPKY